MLIIKKCILEWSNFQTSNLCTCIYHQHRNTYEINEIERIPSEINTNRQQQFEQIEAKTNPPCGMHPNRAEATPHRPAMAVQTPTSIAQTQPKRSLRLWKGLYRSPRASYTAKGARSPAMEVATDATIFDENSDVSSEIPTKIEEVQTKIRKSG